MPAQPNRGEAIFAVALGIADPAQRRDYLDRVCADDAALRSEVESLLVAHEQAGNFLQTEISNSATALSAPLTESPGTRIGRYKLLEQIGEGGFGVVWMAEQEEPVRRRVALKIIKLGMDTREVVARFEAERQAVALMDHPNIARVFDGGATESGRPYFVMELVRGEAITKYCDQNRLNTSERLELCQQVCQAVQHAHQKGVVHRDLKPSNILVMELDGRAAPKVIDFGVARATGQRLTEKTLFTRFGQMVGTPAYMSPEQAGLGGLDIDTRSDVYSLGVVLYELLTSRTPFDAKKLLAAGCDSILRSIREVEPPKPSTRLSTLLPEELNIIAQQRRAEPQKLNRLVRGELDWIVMKALEKDRNRRYVTAQGLANDLNRYLRDEAVEASPPSVGYRLQKIVRRYRVAVGFTAALAVSLIAGMVVSMWQAWRADRFAQEADDQRQIATDKAATVTRLLGDSETARKEAEQQRQRAETEETRTRHLLYVTKMNLAQRDWEVGNIRRLRQLLVETQNDPARGFEWFYWQRQLHLEHRNFAGHLSQLFTAAFSPDGQRVVTGSLDKTAKVWDVASGRELLSFTGHSNGVTSAAFSRDGKRIVTGSWDNTARVWDAGNGREIHRLKGHPHWIWSVAFSPDDQQIVTGSWDQTARVWNAESGEQLAVLSGHQRGIWSACFSPDGRRICTASSDRTAKVWDARSGEEVLTLSGHGNMVISIAFSPDSQRIITGGADGIVKVWNAHTGDELDSFRAHANYIRSVAFSVDGLRILTGGEDQIAKIWDAASLRELFSLKGHAAGVTSASFSPDKELILTSSWDGTAKLWEAASGGHPLTLKGHSAGVTAVAFSGDGHRIVTGSDDKTARIWDAAIGRELLTLDRHSTHVTSVSVSPNGQRIVTGSLDGTTKVWDALTSQELFNFQAHANSLRCVTFSPDGQRIGTGGERTVRIWDALSGRELFPLRGYPGPGGVWCVAFSPDGNRVAAGGFDSTVRIWDAMTGQEMITLVGHSVPSHVGAVAFSPDGERIVTGSWDKTAKVWDAGSGRILLTLNGHAGYVSSVAFSPNGQRILTGSGDHAAKLWDATTGHTLLTLEGHADSVVSVAFSPDGQQIATAGSDGTAMVWRTASQDQVSAWLKEEQLAEQREAAFQRVYHEEQQRKGAARAESATESSRTSDGRNPDKLP